MKTNNGKRRINAFIAFVTAFVLAVGTLSSVTPTNVYAEDEATEDVIVETNEDAASEELRADEEVMDEISKEDTVEEDLIVEDEVVVETAEEETVSLFTATVTDDSEEGALNTSEIVNATESDGVTVSVTAPVGSFPEGTVAHIDAIDDATAASYANAIEDNDGAVAFDIYFTYEENRVQPEEGQSVAITFTVNAESTLTDSTGDINVYHVGDSSKDLLGTATVTETGSSVIATVSATSFSPYVLLKTDDSTEDTEPGISLMSVESLPLAPYVTSITLYRNGVEIDSGTTVAHGDAIKAQMTFTIAGSAMAQTRTYTYQLPTNVKYTAQNGNVIAGSVVAGTYTVNESGLLTFYLYDETVFDTDNTDASGTFEITGSASYTSSATEDETKFLYSDGSKVIVVTNPGTFTVEKSVERETGALSANQTLNYAVEINSTTGTNGTVTINDSLSQTGDELASYSYDANSFTVTEKGNVITGYTLAVAADGKSFTITGLPALAENGSYIVTYDVNVTLATGTTTDYNTTSSLKNTVEVTSAGVTEKDTASIAFPQVVNKSFIRYEAEYGMLWRATIYTNGMDLSGVTISDTAGSAITLVSAIRLYTADDEKFSFHSNDEYKKLININGNTFTFTFPENPSDVDYSQYNRIYVEYYTEGTLTDGQHTDNNTITITTPDGDSWSASAEGIGVITTGDVEKTFLSISDNKKDLTWNFSVDFENLDKIDDKSVTITDNISDNYRISSDGEWQVDGQKLHYAIASELNAAMQSDNLTITLDTGDVLTYAEAVAAGYTFAISFRGANGSSVAASDSETRVYRFYLKVTAPRSQEHLTITNVSFEYPTHFDIESNAGMQYDLINSVTYDRTTVSDHTEVDVDFGSFTKRVATDGYTYVDSATLVRDHTNESAMTKYISFILIGVLGEGETTATFTDTLPEGLNVLQAVVCPFNAAGTQFDINAWSDEDREKYVDITTKDNTVTVNVTGLGEEDGLWINDYRQIGVEIYVEIEDIATLSDATIEKTTNGISATKTFVNTGSFNGISDSADITITDLEEVIYKSGVQSTTNSSAVNYTVEINPNAVDLMENSDVLTLTDTITSKDLSVELVRNSVKLYYMNEDGSKGAEASPIELHFNYPVTKTDGSVSQTFDMTINDSTAYILEYTYNVSPISGKSTGDGELDNDVVLAGVFATGENTEVSGASSSATINAASLRLYKLDADNNSIYLNGAKFTLEEIGSDGTGTTVIEEFDISGENGFLFDYESSANVLEFDTLYAIYETKAPTGYIRSDKVYYFVIVDNETAAATAAGYAPEGAEVHMLSKNSASYYDFENEKSVVTVAGSKTWNDNGNADNKRPESITIRVMNGETEVASKVVTANDKWSWEFTDLPEYDSEGNKITYTIEEDTVSGYTSTVSGYNVTNTLNVTESGSVSFSIQKYETGTTTPLEGAEFVLSDADNTTLQTAATDENGIATFTFLFTDETGPITLTLKEKKAPEGYILSDDTWTVTLTRNGVKSITLNEDTNFFEKIWNWIVGVNPDANYSNGVLTVYNDAETIDVEGIKTWDDADDKDGKRPESITVVLYADGEVIDSVEVSADDNWEYNFENLPKYAEGDVITYTVAEEKVPEGYTAVIEGSATDGFTITNSHTPETIDITGTKTWDDADDQDGKRPESITVNLLIDDEIVDSKTITADDNWAYSFTDLDKYADGIEIVYTIEEVAVDGYETTVDGYDITNSHTPETIDISGTKTWEDADDQDGKRPESITVRLYANGTEVDSVTVTADGNWAYSFTELAKYADGEEIVYTISEDAVTDYSTTYDGYDITNSYTPGKTSITVNKVWNDSNDKDGIRPTSIQVQLYANGEAYGDAVTLSADNSWRYTWTDLDVKSNKEDIVYTVKEVTAVAGYTTVVGEVKNGSVTITNTHTPATATPTPTPTSTTPTSTPTPKNPTEPKNNTTRTVVVPNTSDDGLGNAPWLFGGSMAVIAMCLAVLFRNRERKA